MKKKRKDPGILALKVTGICLLFAVVGVVVFLVIYMIHKNTDNTTEDAQKQQIQKLESLYTAKDYKAITGIIRTNNLYTSAFGKYWEIADVCYYQDIMKEYLKNLQEDKTGDKKIITQYLEYMISYGCISIRMAESYASDGADYGNRDVLKSLATESRNLFEQRMKFTKEEIAALLSIKDGTQISDYAKKACERLY